MSGAAGLVLAAGAGRRYGRPKALLELAGERLVDRAVRLLAAGGCEPVVVVAGAAPLQVSGATVVDNPAWAEGIGSSLRAGLAALPADRESVVVTLVDTPWLTPAAVRRVRDAGREGAELAVATYAGRRGHPVLLARAHWAGAAAAACGDEGARAYLAARDDVVREVPCDGLGDPRDVDHPDDLAGPRP